MLVWESFLLAFSALLPLINPLGSALVFLGLVGDAPPEVFRSLARRIAVNNVIFLAIIELLGSAILKFFGISLPIVQLSGGIVIASIGWSVLKEPDADASMQDKREESGLDSEFYSKALEQKAFYPFTFPVTSGPGTLVAMLTLTARIDNHSVASSLLGHLGIFLAVLLLSASVYFCYGYAPAITRKVSPGTVHGILRVIAFILLCIGVQIAWNGIATLLTTVLRH
jgi:multiple antibiotic resistance protein